LPKEELVIEASLPQVIHGLAMKKTHRFTEVYKYIAYMHD
jgi:hypothetical protein